MAERPDRGGHTVLVTGASSGIGEALARCFARDGHRVLLVARRAERLQALVESLAREHGARAEALPADLAAPGGVDALVDALHAKRCRVDILVNNAGVLAQGPFVRQSPAAARSMVELNVAAPTALLARLLPGMLERGFGRVLNVASIAAFQPVPMLATYAATKAYLLSLTESLAEELRGRGVTVTALCPGVTATGMLDAAAAHNARLAELPGFVVGDVDAVAEAGYRACLAGEVIVVPGLVNQAAALASRGMPRALLRRVAGVFGRRFE